MSKMMLVKPSLSIQTSWLSGTCRNLLRGEQLAFFYKKKKKKKERDKDEKGAGWGGEGAALVPDIRKLLGQFANYGAAEERRAVVFGHVGLLIYGCHGCATASGMDGGVV